MKRNSLIVAGLQAGGMSLMAGAGLAADIDPARIVAAGTDAEAGNWLTNHKSYDSNRFSTLDSINAKTVLGLHLVFSVPVGGGEPGAGGPGSMEGTSLALDFPQREPINTTLFTRIDAIVREAGGRVYPAKDAHMSGADFRAFYPQWEQVEALRDPALLSRFWERTTRT